MFPSSSNLVVISTKGAHLKIVQYANSKYSIWDRLMTGPWIGNLVHIGRDVQGDTSAFVGSGSLNSFLDSPWKINICYLSLFLNIALTLLCVCIWAA